MNINCLIVYFEQVFHVLLLIDNNFHLIALQIQLDFHLRYLINFEVFYYSKLIHQFIGQMNFKKSVPAKLQLCCDYSDYFNAVHIINRQIYELY